MSKKGIEDGLATLARNSDDILSNLTSFVANGSTPGRQRMTNAIGALAGPKSRIVLFMPTPDDYLTPNPLKVVDLPLTVNVGKQAVKVILYFGGGRFRGRFFGVGTIASTVDADVRKPHQFFRMDYHSPTHAMTPPSAWSDGQYHFQVLDERRSAK